MFSWELEKREEGIGKSGTNSLADLREGKREKSQRYTAAPIACERCPRERRIISGGSGKKVRRIELVWDESWTGEGEAGSLPKTQGSEREIRL